MQGWRSASCRRLTGVDCGARRGAGRETRAWGAIASASGEAVQRAYWGIQNHAFVQGELFEVSEACSSVLIAALADPREKWVRIAVLELLFQILSGHASTAPHAPVDIALRCREAIREGLWLLLREALDGERAAALDVLAQLGEGARLRRLLSADE